MAINRRQVLVSSAVLLSSGCVATSDGPSTDDTSASSDDECTSGVDVSGKAFDPADDLVASLDDDERALVAEAVESGSAERATYGEKLLTAGIFVEQNGTFYETDVTVAGSESIQAYRLDLSWEKGREPPSDATTVAFADLPKADRSVLRLAVGGSGEEGEKSHPSQSLQRNDYPAPYPDGADSSQLVGNGVVWVQWNDRAYRVSVGDLTTQERRVFRYSVENVAESPTEFRRFAASAFRVNLEDVPDEEHNIVEQALDEGYEECSPPSDALEGLRARLSEEKRLPIPRYGSWYVRFDGGDYLLSIMNWVE